METILLYIIDRFKNMLDYAVLAMIASTACILVLPSWRDNWGYMFGAICAGVTVGWCIEQTSYSEWSSLAAALATVIGPASIIMLQGAVGRLPTKWVKIYSVLKDRDNDNNQPAI
jgi:hypothetical protein